ncbi:MAG: glycosyltransferase family 4 protein [Acetobacter sp.]|nr:glycosyltransferase family 4 protein [Acetobacter sp.]MBQ5774079.1 glycosyltransferase family 4 protein [Acetobacter sp.]
MTTPAILQILPALDEGGIEQGTLEIADSIVRAGGKAIVASAGGRLEIQLRHSGVEHICLPKIGSRNPIYLARNIRTVRQILEDRKINLVHARSRIPAWVTRFACQSNKIPFVTTWHGVHANTFPGKKLYNAVLASGDRVIAISQFIAKRLEDEYHVDAHRLRIIPRGVNTQRFSPEAVNGQRIHQLAEKWRIPINSPVILVPGRLTAWKGQGFVLQALSGLSISRPELKWCCIFVGSTSAHQRYVRNLLAQTDRFNLSHRVHFAGHCDDVPAALALSTMVIVPSLKPEPFGRVIIEAQAMCKPVIVTQHNTATETVQKGITGLCVPPRDPLALAHAIAWILKAPHSSLSKMTTAARNMVIARYTTSAMQHATLRVYDELLQTSLASTFVDHTS